MKKLVIFCLGLVSISFTLSAMEGDDRFAPHEWRSRRLGLLLEETKSPTCNERNRRIREIKKEFVHNYLDKYEQQQGILSDLCKETSGVIRSTVDPELVQEDSNKFLCIQPLDYTAEQIDARWQRIHQTDCKYSGPRKLADDFSQADTGWKDIGVGVAGITSPGSALGGN